VTAVKPNTLVTALKLGLRSMRRHPGLALMFLAATLSQGVLQGLIVWALREVLRAFSSGGVSLAALTLGASLVFGIWLLRAFGTFAGELLSVRLARRVEIDSMQQVLAKLLTLSVRFFERSSQGDLVMASYTDLQGIRSVTLHVGTIVLSISRLAGLAVVAWLLSPKLALIGLVGAPLGVVPVYSLGRRITAAARRAREATEKLYDSFLQVSSGIKVIKVNRGERAVLEHARTVGENLYRNLVRDARSGLLARFSLEAVAGVGLVTVLMVGGRDVGRGVLEWQSLLGLLIALMAVYAPTLNLVTVYASIRSVIPNLDRIDAILQALPDLRDAADARPLPAAPRTIELQDVSFAYDDGDRVLDGITVTFHQGETIGIVGPSGAGKSTLVALLLRLYDPTSGRILCDGVDLRHIRHADLMDRCAIVLQEPFLFVDTIAQNIRLARPEASLEEVVAAARAANIHDDIMRMEHGYETVLGRRRDGRGVSVGQKQRIAIAAALLKNAPILFLDEATSNLDSVSERAVQGAVERLMAGRTAFVIAHRLSTLRAVDRILVLERGRIVGLGSHEELLATCGLYRQLWQSQSFDKAPGAMAWAGDA